MSSVQRLVVGLVSGAWVTLSAFPGLSVKVLPVRAEPRLARPAADGEVVSAAGVAYVLHLPTPLPATSPEGERPPVLEDFELGLCVSRDEETVEVSLRGPDGVRVLSPRAHHYTLLTLARLRLRSRDEAALDEAQRGWVSADDLCRMLGIDDLQLNVQIYRLRREVASLGLGNAAQLVERRRGRRQLRLGTKHVVITGLA